MLNRLVSFWVYGGALAAILLLLLSPLLARNWSMLMLATFLHLPIYMIHQLEEHDQDRFRTFFNQTICQGHDALSKTAVFVTNVPGVWLVITAALYAASAAHPGWCLVAVYLVLVNAFVHIAHAILFRRYNPGLGTALLLFLPLGCYTLWLVHHTQSATLLHHAAGVTSAVLIHLAILLHVQRRVRDLQRQQSISAQ
ncbi:HXXEE domain-containing protein [Alkalinema sp. FACHB-956]|uniref:HXXEE domain-containing protein n=1 Tax=Alkalinema sp. FACHB-956 TaxID=2692768 RepID=UPI001682DEB4|nr:HXXEE domain-containing protein [Alkalinema sp. FACHB-956]MBD2327122.1 HXXEE domain-containing protein [Alkalinema sp. FACHB-956]